jgi:Sugar (pentulose and hexulose) kinases
METVLTFDCGTQSVRAMIFDDKGEPLAKVKVCYEPYFPNSEGRAEQRAELYYEKLCEASKKLKEEVPELFGSVRGVAVTTMRDVAICLDKDGKPLGPAILYLDRRKASNKNKLPFTSRLVLKLTGMLDVAETNRADCRGNWLAEFEPELWKKTDKFVQLSTYLNFRMTGEMKDGIASTIGHIPINYKGRDWLPENNFRYPLFMVEKEKLYPLVEPSEAIGKITKECADDSGIKEGLPLFASGSDKGCETLGAGAYAQNVASISLGTSATVQITTKKYVEPLTFLPAYPAVAKNRFNPEIMVNRGYWTLTWFVNEFCKAEGKPCAERDLDVEMIKLPPGSEGLLVLPYWGAGLKHPEGKGAMFGFDERHSLIHIYRAIIEGVNFALIEGLEGLEKKAKVKIDTLTISGGGARSDEVCKLTADMFGRPVVRAQTYETSGLGAAICAFVGLGTFKDIDAATKAMVRVSSRFEPDAEAHKKYRGIYEKVFKGAYETVRPVFLRMKK